MYTRKLCWNLESLWTNNALRRNIGDPLDPRACCLVMLSGVGWLLDGWGKCGEGGLGKFYIREV